VESSQHVTTALPLFFLSKILERVIGANLLLNTQLNVMQEAPTKLSISTRSPPVFSTAISEALENQQQWYSSQLRAVFVLSKAIPLPLSSERFQIYSCLPWFNPCPAEMPSKRPLVLSGDSLVCSTPHLAFAAPTLSLPPHMVRHNRALQDSNLVLLNRKAVWIFSF
jgi:hypothetical protein